MKYLFKGALCCFGEEIQTQDFKMYNNNEIITQTHKYVSFPQLNKLAVPRGK